MTEVFKNLDWSVLTGMLMSVIPALICITVHEYSHGYVALRLGDTTAKDIGRLSLNPIRHIDFFGLIMMALLGFGWAKPVPIDMRRFKNPKKGMALSALAGPVSNIILAVVFLFIYGFVWRWTYESGIKYAVAYTVSRTAVLSVSLAVFNIIPVPPLDGSKVLFSLMSDEAYYKLMRYERYGMILLIVILFSGILDGVLSTAVNFVLDKLFFAVKLGLKISVLL